MKRNEKENEMNNYTNVTIDLMDDEKEETIVWSDGAVEVIYAHNNDNFELWVFSHNGWELRSEFDKSADAVRAAENLERHEG